jgi:iron complex outermembrane receptor protein
MKRMGVLMVLLLFTVLAVNAQHSDTVLLEEVTIQATPIEKLSGYKRTPIDSVALNSLNYESFSELLSNHTPVFMKTYGQGNLSTASFRGTGASHTKVLWNGVELNNPMLGQADFSQIPVAVADKVSLSHGGAGIHSGSGSLGGSIIIENEPQWGNHLNVQLKQSAASYSNYRSQALVTAGGERFRSRSLLITQSAENNYFYRNNYKDRDDPPREQREGAGYASHTVLQEFYYRDKRANKLAARVWVQDYYREIAPPLGVNPATTEQQQRNEAVRAMAEWEHNKGKVELTLKSAYVYDYLNYKNSLAAVNSHNYAHQFMQSINMKMALSGNLRWSANVSYTTTRVHSNNYNGLRERSDLTVFAGGQWSPGDDANVRLMLRQKVIDGTMAPLIPSLGFDYRLLEERDLLLKGNISRNYRLPTLNDLYWQPGGDPELLPERGFTLETGVKYLSQKRKGWHGGAEITWFRNDISNWIAWQPDSIMSYWTPKNITEVLSQGIEARYQVSLNNSRLKVQWEQSYTYTSAKNVSRAQPYSSGKQLVYIPQHSLQSSINVAYRDYMLDIGHHFTGSRYTSSDNTSYMPPFSTIDLVVSTDFSLNKKMEGALLMKVNNVTNTNYQVVAWYPMPGRNYEATLSVKFNAP